MAYDVPPHFSHKRLWQAMAMMRLLFKALLRLFMPGWLGECPSDVMEHGSCATSVCSQLDQVQEEEEEQYASHNNCSLQCTSADADRNESNASVNSSKDSSDEGILSPTTSQHVPGNTVAELSPPPQFINEGASIETQTLQRLDSTHTTRIQTSGDVSGAGVAGDCVLSTHSNNVLETIVSQQQQQQQAHSSPATSAIGQNRLGPIQLEIQSRFLSETFARMSTGAKVSDLGDLLFACSPSGPKPAAEAPRQLLFHSPKYAAPLPGLSAASTRASSLAGDAYITRDKVGEATDKEGRDAAQAQAQASAPAEQSRSAHKGMEAASGSSSGSPQSLGALHFSAHAGKTP